MRHHLSRRQLIASALVASIGASQAAPTLAQTPVASPEASAAPRFAILPAGETPNGYPELDLEPGTSGAIHVGVVVEGTMPADLVLYRADTIPATGGGFAAAEFDVEPEGHSLWLDIDPVEFRASPGERREFAVPVHVPADAAPGQYVAALVVQTGPLDITGSTMFSQIIRSAIPVVINVPGEITPGMEIGEPEIAIQGGRHFIRIPVRNTGNILIKPEGTVIMTTADGKELITAPVAMKPIYLGMDNEIRVAIPDQVPEGDYLVSCDIHEEKHGLDAAMENVPVTLKEPEPEETPEPVTFSVDQVAVTPNGDPVQFADIAVTFTNHRSNIPTARISLVAMHDGEEVETYDLANGQAIPPGTSTVAQRYLPASGWKPGTWTFRVIVAAVDSAGASALLADIDAQETIVIP